MAQAHRIRDLLHQRVESDHAVYSHLAGRAVLIQKNSASMLPKKDGPLIHEIALALKENKGVLLFEGINHVPGDRGRYGRYGPFEVTVQAIPGIDGIGIFVACEFQVRRSEAIAALANRVAIKDKPGNDILIVTCRVPDPYGWVSASDHAIFQQLLRAHQSGVNIMPKKPTHIRGIMIHASPDSPELILLNDSDDVPWLAPLGTTVPAAPPRGPLIQSPIANT